MRRARDPDDAAFRQFDKTISHPIDGVHAIVRLQRGVPYPHRAHATRHRTKNRQSTKNKNRNPRASSGAESKRPSEVRRKQVDPHHDLKILTTPVSASPVPSE
jgi:hypothetical protein